MLSDAGACQRGQVNLSISTSFVCLCPEAAASAALHARLPTKLAPAPQNSCGCLTGASAVGEPLVLCVHARRLLLYGVLCCHLNLHGQPDNIALRSEQLHCTARNYAPKIGGRQALSGAVPFHI